MTISDSVHAPTESDLGSYSPVLASGTDSLSYKPRLIDFCGYEGEDFRHFRDTLESYFAITNQKNAARKASILNAQVRKYARIFLQGKIRATPALGVDYDELIKLLEEEYVTADVIEYYKDAFDQLLQGEDELPRMFLGRIQQAADLAELSNKAGEALIEAKFKSGLLPRIKKHCYMMGAKSFNDYKQFAYGFWRGQHGVTLYPQDNPFIPQKAEERIPTAWVNRNDPSKETIKKARSRAFHPPDLNTKSGSDSPSIDILTKQMQNLELYQHESDPTRNDYQNNSPNELERLLRRLIQEETKRITQTTNPYNNRWDRNNNRNQYNNNGYRNNQYRNNNSYQPHGNNRGNDNQYQNNNPYQPYGNNRGNDNQQNRRFGESRPGESRFRNNDNNKPAYRKTNPTRPNSPSATLAVMEEKDTVYEEIPFDFNLINQEFEDEYIYDNEEGYNTNEYYDIRDDNDYYDDDLQIHEENFDELYAAQQRAPLPRTRQLRPRNETGKVNKVNSQKKVDFVDPPVRRKSRKQKQATQLQDNHMNSQTYQETNGAASTLQNVEPATIPNIEKLPLPPPPLPTTGLASTFGESTLNKTQNITGNQ